jgi:hypothetical protein
MAPNNGSSSTSTALVAEEPKLGRDLLAVKDVEAGSVQESIV